MGGLAAPPSGRRWKRKKKYAVYSVSERPVMETKEEIGRTRWHGSFERRCREHKSVGVPRGRKPRRRRRVFAQSPRPSLSCEPRHLSPSEMTRESAFGCVRFSLGRGGGGFSG